MTELDAHQMQRLLMPQYCRWFAGSGSQELMLGIYRAQGGLSLGWDTGSGGKMFGMVSHWKANCGSQICLQHRKEGSDAQIYRSN